MHGWTFVRVLSGTIVLAITAASAGCCTCYGPDRSVEVVLRGASDSARWQATETLLPVLVDDPPEREICWTSWEGGPPLIVQIGPVADPKILASRIQFGTVERIDGRTIYVKVDEEKARTQTLVVEVAQFIKSVPPTLSELLFIGRIKVIAWWTGRSEGEVFWSELRRMSTTLREQEGKLLSPGGDAE